MRAPPKRSLLDIDREEDFDDPGMQLLGEEMMMMVPPPVKKTPSFSKKSSSSMGPVIMNPEPEGFICPANTNSSSKGSSSSSSSGIPTKKNVKIR